MCLVALDGIALKAVSARLALRLFLLAERGFSTAKPPGVTISQGGLAMMVGATRQSVNKELKGWERAGVIRMDGRRLTILDDDALLRLARE